MRRTNKSKSTPGKAPPKAPAPVQSGFPAWLFAGLLVLATVLAYQPVWHAGYIWDDGAYVTGNPMLTAPDGLSQIWFSAHKQSQYFPLVYTTLRYERMLWGLNPLGYHLVNVLLHSVNALLLWQLLRRLAVPGAWLAAAIFALHPVQVESVAWITELKNIESTLFYLLALLAWVKFIEKPAVPQWNFYGLALFCCACALFSKTTACTLPAALLLILWWRRDPIGGRRVLQVVPFLVMGVAMGVLSVWWEKHLGNYNDPGAGVHLSLVDKILIATRAVWFYAAKVFWPANLTFSYPHWAIDPQAPGQYLGLAGCIGLGLLLWWRRRNLGRGIFAGVVFFIAALSPMLGFIPLYTFRFSFVADHYQYLACAGLIIPFAALLANRLMTGRPGRVFYRGLAGGLLLALGVLTWKQAHAYETQEMLWQDTLVKNPASWLAHNDLGTIFADKGRLEEAMEQFQEAIRFEPDYPEAYNNLGNILLKKGRIDEAIGRYQDAIRINPDYFEAHYNLGVVLLKQGRTEEAIQQFEEAVRSVKSGPAHKSLGLALYHKGRVDEAIGQFQEAIKLQPDDSEAYYDLGDALFDKGRPDQAISQYREAIRLQPDNADAHYHFGVVLLDQGRSGEAISQFQETLKLKPDHADAHNNLGISFYNQGRIEEAIGQFQEALRLKPDNANAHYNLGGALLDKGQTDEGIRQLQEAVRLDPGDGDAQKSLKAALELKSK